MNKWRIAWGFRDTQTIQTDVFISDTTISFNSQADASPSDVTSWSHGSRTFKQQKNVKNDFEETRQEYFKNRHKMNIYGYQMALLSRVVSQRMITSNPCSRVRQPSFNPYGKMELFSWSILPMMSLWKR